MIDMNLPVMFYLHCIDLLLLVHSAIKDLGLGLEACGLGFDLDLAVARFDTNLVKKV